MDIKLFIEEYGQNIQKGLNGIDMKAFESITDLLTLAYKGKKKVIVAGNGGSAASANHFVADFWKNAVGNGGKRIKVLSLSDNVEKITAVGNDISFESVFSEQLNDMMDDGDVLFLISASGNSPNILQAAGYSLDKGCKVISLTGFQGGKLKGMSTVNMNASLDSYEQIEDMHLIILHMIVYWYRNNPDILAD